MTGSDMAGRGAQPAQSFRSLSAIRRMAVIAFISALTSLIGSQAHASFPAVTEQWAAGENNNCVLGGSLVNNGGDPWSGGHCSLFSGSTSAGAEAACQAFITARGGSLDQSWGRWIFYNGEGHTNYACHGVFGGTGYTVGSATLGGVTPFCTVANATASGSQCNCNTGFQQAGAACSGGKNNAMPKSCSLVAGNPVNAANGNKIEMQPVYQGVMGFQFSLTFNSFDYSGARFSKQWRDSFDRAIVLDTTTTAVVYRPNGQVFQFTLSLGSWVTDADTNEALVELKDGSNVRTGWKLTTVAGDEVETYDANGKLLSIASREQLTQSLTYSDGTSGANGGYVLDASGNATTTVLPAGLLIRVTDHFGRQLAFGYDSLSRVIKMTDPATGVYRFGYVNGDKLGSVTFPDTKVRTYVYNESTYTGGANLPWALTGIVDENNSRFATFTYDSQGRATGTTHAGGANSYTLSYSSGSTTVTSPLSEARTLATTTILGGFRNTGITGSPAPECGPASQSFDTNGNVSARVDWNGNRTNYSYDTARNLETSRTEALTSSGATTAQTRTTSTQWHTTFRLPTGIAEPLRITTYTYDADGSSCGARGAMCSKSVQATSDTNGSQGFSATTVGSARTWTYTYNANGSVLTVNGPRTDVSDVTTYTYYSNTNTDLGKRGNVATITNAASHVTEITSYNAHGQPLTIVDQNGLTTTLAYDARQRITSRTVGGETTSYEYDGVGQLKKVTLPDGSYLVYSYDAAHRLIGIKDNDDDGLANKISYTLDAMGNRTLEEVRDPSNSLKQKRSREYNSLNRLIKDIGALTTEVTQYGYDNQGNVTSVTNPLSKVTSNQYDALNRLKQVTDPVSGVTQYAYNGLDGLTQVTDPRSLSTAYTVDGLGNLTLQSSPDTGSTSSTYDAAGNLLTQTDAKSQVTTYAYDALNRVTLITFHDGSKQAYAYDQGTNGLGRLRSITETNASNVQTSLIQFAYDQHGRVTSETRTVAGVAYVVGYGYDSYGRMSGMTYPSGRTVSYGFDSLGRVNQVNTTKPGESQVVLVQNVQYQPFGGVKSFTLGNGQIYSRTIDQDGRVAAYTLGATSFALTFDAAGRISGIGSNTYGYDDLDRLTSAVLSSSNFGYTYDGVGNRLTKVVGTSTDTYAYSSTSNRISTLTPAVGSQRGFTLDSNGSTTNDGVNTYAYDTRGRMTSATSSAGTANYQVNALGQRVKKSTSTSDTVFHYDTRGRLVAETDATGTVKRELFYLGDIPVAVYQ